MPAQTIPLGSQAQLDELEWLETDRYEIRRELGHGGMGIVYEAFDRERQQAIALKTVLHFSPDALYLFKQEFRTLADVQHPNLVHLYELVANETDRLYFTMELVLGTDFVSHSQKADLPRQRVVFADAEAKSRERPTDRPRARRDAPSVAAARRESPADMGKLRATFRQLVEGVQALHSAGKLHRDIKPSNVLVTHEGRVVVLDFGVATDLSRTEPRTDEEAQVVGTANYMAPEQGAGEPPTPACDWYSVGVMLYEALVGTPPFVGPMMDVIMMKNTLEPRAPASVVDGVPADLDALCLALLSSAPDERPTGPELLRQFGSAASTSQAPPRPSRLPTVDRSAPTRLVGRDAHLKTLRDAFEATLRGTPITIRVSGRSGMGKSSLVDHFLDGLVDRGEAVVLRGRAYERESVPFKAVDSVIDSLSRHLMRLTDHAEALTLPNGIGALARIFPVLRRVPSVLDAPEPKITNPQRVRTRAFAALRDLMKSLARRQPLVIYVDDAQWGDNDSAALLLDLMHPSDAPPVLLVMAHREEEASTSPFLLETNARWPERAEVRNLQVGALDAADARRLALALLGDEDEAPENPTVADEIANESNGSPFLIDELARSVSGEHQVGLQSDPAQGKIVTLEQVVGKRIGRLPLHAARFLEVVAIAGKPLSVSIVRAASEVDESAEEVVALLRARRFVRAGLRDGHEVVETSHDRIRETIVGALSEDVVRGHHRRLATVLEGRSGIEAEAVAVHLFGAGENARAADYAERAAREAIAKLAFDQAARLLKLTLATAAPDSQRAQTIRVRLAEALKWSGRSSEAGTVYLEAAAHATTLERATLEREAAEQLLTSGRLAEGSVVLGRVLNGVGMSAPRSPLGALFWLLVYRFALTFVGFSFKERKASEIAPETHLRLKAMLAAATGYGTINVIYGACVEARYLLMALRAGDPLHVLRAVTFEVSHLASLGGLPGRRERTLLQLAERLGDNMSDLEVGMAVEATRGMSLFLRGHWKRTRELYDIEYAKYRHARAGGHTAASLFSLFSLFFLGEMRELARRRTQMLIEAEQRGDLYMSVNLRASVASSVWLAADDPATARRQVREAMALWPKDTYLTTHWQALVCEVELDLYEGDGVAAYERIRSERRQVNRSLLLNVQFVRAAHCFLRGRAAVASASMQPNVRDKRLVEARAMIKRLQRERMPWTTALAATLAAAVANLAGDRHATIAALRGMIDLGQASDMPNTVNAARYRLGTLLGQDSTALLERALEAMAAEDIKCPPRWVQLVLPGRWPEA